MQMLTYSFVLVGASCARQLSIEPRGVPFGVLLFCCVMEYKGRLWSALGTFGVPCGVWEKLGIKVWIN
jgi:hypothetical protein